MNHKKQMRWSLQRGNEPRAGNRLTERGHAERLGDRLDILISVGRETVSEFSSFWRTRASFEVARVCIETYT
jgi:hypothetical protein